MKRRQSSIFRVVLYTLITMVFISLDFFFCYTLKKKVVEKTLSYVGTSEISYKVFLKENKYFEEPYLEMDRPYISSLIDYIDVNFIYTLSLSNNTDGEYAYFIRGIISADQTNNMSKYWSKTYQLTEPKVLKIDNEQNYLIKENIKLDYQKYNEIIKDFRKEFGINFNGKFNLELVVKNDIEGLKEPVSFEHNPILSVPLTQSTIEIAFDKKNVNDTKTVNDYKELTQTEKTTCQIMIVLTTIVSIILTMIIINLSRKIYNQTSKYKRELNRILTTYDSIIVNIKSVPKVNTLSVIQVNDFNELLDAHNEVRMPINFVEEKNKYSSFILMNDKFAWVYILVNEDYKEKANKSIKHLK